MSSAKSPGRSDSEEWQGEPYKDPSFSLGGRRSSGGSEEWQGDRSSAGSARPVFSWPEQQREPELPRFPDKGGVCAQCCSTFDLEAVHLAVREGGTVQPQRRLVFSSHGDVQGPLVRLEGEATLRISEHAARHAGSGEREASLAARAERAERRQHSLQELNAHLRSRDGIAPEAEITAALARERGAAEGARVDELRREAELLRSELQSARAPEGVEPEPLGSRIRPRLEPLQPPPPFQGLEVENHRRLLRLLREGSGLLYSDNELNVSASVSRPDAGWPPLPGLWASVALSFKLHGGSAHKSAGGFSVDSVHLECSNLDVASLHLEVEWPSGAGSRRGTAKCMVHLELLDSAFAHPKLNVRAQLASEATAHDAVHYSEHACSIVLPVGVTTFLRPLPRGVSFQSLWEAAGPAERVARRSVSSQMWSEPPAPQATVALLGVAGVLSSFELPGGSLGLAGELQAHGCVHEPLRVLVRISRRQQPQQPQQPQQQPQQPQQPQPRQHLQARAPRQTLVATGARRASLARASQRWAGGFPAARGGQGRGDWDAQTEASQLSLADSSQVADGAREPWELEARSQEPRLADALLAELASQLLCPPGDPAACAW